MIQDKKRTLWVAIHQECWKVKTWKSTDMIQGMTEYCGLPYIKMVGKLKHKNPMTWYCTWQYCGLPYTKMVGKLKQKSNDVIQYMTEHCGCPYDTGHGSILDVHTPQVLKSLNLKIHWHDTGHCGLPCYKKTIRFTTKQ